MADDTPTASQKPLALPSVQKAKPRRPRGWRIAQTWIRAFVRFYGTENVTRFCAEDLHGVSLARVVAALRKGLVMSMEKCQGPGTICTIEHFSDDDCVEVTVFFESQIMTLEIQGARIIEEQNDEHDAA